MSKGAPTQEEEREHVEKALELLHSAYINIFTNLLDRMLPGNPMAAIGKFQFKEGLKILGREVD